MPVPVFFAAAPNLILVMLVIGVTVIFYLVQLVFKSSISPKNPRAPARPGSPRPAASPQGQPRAATPSKPITSLEDYLKEARLKRAQQAQSPGMPQVMEKSPTPGAAQSIPDFQQVMPDQPKLRNKNTPPVRVQGQARKTTAPRPQATASQPASALGSMVEEFKQWAQANTAQVPGSKPPPQTTRQPKPATSINSPSASNQFADLSAPVLQESSSGSANRPLSPLTELLRTTLADSRGAAVGMVWREIMAPPLSRRGRPLGAPRRT